MGSFEAAKQIFKQLAKDGGFGRLLSKVEILEGGNGNLTACMKVEREDCNAHGTLHGAFSTLLVDNMSGIALLTNPNITSAGVSVQLNMTYIKAAAIGEEILIKSTTDKVGKRLAFLTVDIVNRKNGDLIAKGTHTKYIG